MEQISISLRSVDICSISESCFLTCFEFWVENVSRDIDNIKVMKSKYLDEITGGRGLTFASGTPVETGYQR